MLNALPIAIGFNAQFSMKGITLILLTIIFSLPVFGQEIKKIKITDLEKIIAESKAPLVINFWATFCKPCMEEIPFFQKLGKKYEKEGVGLLLVILNRYQIC